MLFDLIIVRPGLKFWRNRFLFSLIKKVRDKGSQWKLWRTAPGIPGNYYDAEIEMDEKTILETIAREVEERARTGQNPREAFHYGKAVMRPFKRLFNHLKDFAFEPPPNVIPFPATRPAT